MAAAKEFNVGKDTLVDFLVARGFSSDDLKPTSKLSEDMYRSLQQEFAGDKVAKLKSDQIDLPKGTTEARKRKEDEAVLFQKGPRKLAEEAAAAASAAAAEAAPRAASAAEGSSWANAPAATAASTKAEVSAKVEAPAKEEAKPEPKVTAPDTVESPAILSDEEVAKPATAAKAAEPAETTAKAEKPKSKAKEDNKELPVAKETEKAPEHLKIDAPELEEPVVLDKIDLSTIDSSTRPKKTTKKKEEAAPAASVAKTADAEGATAKKAAAAETSAKAAAPAEATAKGTASAEALAKTEGPEVNADENAPVITNIRAEKLEGPKILGKIDLPTSGAPKPATNDEKRQRKRIPIQRKDTPVQRNDLFKRRDDTPRPPGQGGVSHGGGGATFRPGQNRSGPGQHRPAASGPRPAFLPREQKEIDKKEIQDKIRETQAKLAGSGGRGKSLKAKYRRAKRDEVSDQRRWRRTAGQQTAADRIYQRQRTGQPDGCELRRSHRKMYEPGSDGIHQPASRRGGD